MKRERKAYTVEEREMQIIGAITINVQRGGKWWLTTAEIARYLHMTPSTHLRLILNGMVAEGKLNSCRESDPGIAKFRVLFTVPDNDTLAAIHKARRAAKIEPKIREIVINGQATLWGELPQ